MASTQPFPSVPSPPALSVDQMIEVDRIMVDELRIDLVQMMENAGRALARVARDRFLAGDARGKSVAILAGSGGNGGGALVCARNLLNWGAEVHCALVRPVGHYGGVPAHQAKILDHMGQQLGEAHNDLPPKGVDLVVDGLIGYSLAGAPHGRMATLIRWANEAGAPVLSLDVPSGVDATTGETHDPAVRATATLTLALPKRGLTKRTARGHVGELYLADIGVPPSVYQRLGLAIESPFERADVVRIGR
jgi:NAD(P)H-hydrate epimerase